jgi:hypothetical protein
MLQAVDPSKTYLQLFKVRRGEGGIIKPHTFSTFFLKECRLL